MYELDGDAGPLDEDAADALMAPVGDLALKPGSYLISATMPMYRETRQPVVIQPGENEHLLVVLTPWGMSVPMAARGDELVAIRAAFDSTVSNKRVGSMMVEGGPGLGKAKLLNDFGIFLDGLTDLVAYGVIRCTSLHPMVPFHAVSDFVRHRAGIAFDDQADVIRTKLRDAVRRVYEHNGDVSLAERGEIEMVTRRLASLPSLCGRASNPVAAERAMDGGDYALLVLDAMVSYLRQIAKRIPIVLVIRGADQLDRLSRDLLFYVATQLHDDNLFCLMFSRTDRLQLRCEQVITLEPLARDRIQRQLELLLRATVDSDVVEVITRLSAGNAFYVSELARLLSRRGWLTRAGRHRSFTLEGRSQNFDLATIRALLTDEIEGLSATAREVLQTASVSGDVFWAEQVGRHLGRLIDEELRELAERELIMPTASRFPGTLAYVFRHTDARKMLASSLEATRRQGGHRALAKWVASMATGRLIDVAFEAKHLTLAGDSEAGDVRREILAKVAAGWERDDAPSWFAWPEDLSSGLLDDIG
ncbi:MAG: putative ATPase [Myxococcota bacterium]